ncbi:hypothetical protein G647_08358 [Cladophialophora carrionii CBS 160.54]|uniref:Uncharacterized protein n=1 Tax=Cladophialophora carrionii CBS 160.54 TaxID=1279043 RepID=V9D085_9EURO|nr:uncharacterized protein G647_08358 [Cladophialophora carrionii CBS 160.54]ETI20324.1 hypothetical protein G647_08358 [Cladophialophora carrionii CBS 160.54]
MATSSADDGQANSTPQLDAAPASPHGPVHGPFFDLAVELRLKVYQQLFGFAEPIKLIVDGTGLFKHERTNPAADKIPVHVFRLNKKTYLEASPVLFKCNIFALDLSTLRAGLARPEPMYKHVESLEVCWTVGTCWGYVQTVKAAGEKMPALRKLELKFEQPRAVLAASLEFCSAIMACAPLIGSPELRLCAHLSESEEWTSGGADNRYDFPIRTALARAGSTLRDIQPHPNFHVSPLTRSILPELHLIQLTGKITPSLLHKIEQHVCEMGECTWVRTGEEDSQRHADGTNTGRRIHLRWGKSDGTLVRPCVPEVDMLQFYPELSKSEKKKIQEFFASFQQVVGGTPSVGFGNTTSRQPTTSGTDQAAVRPPEAHSDADRQTRRVGNGDYAHEDVNTATRPHAHNATSAASAQTGPATPAITHTPEENLQALQALPFANYHSDLVSEFAHPDTKDDEAAWAAVFAVIARDFGIASTGAGAGAGAGALAGAAQRHKNAFSICAHYAACTPDMYATEAILRA